MSEKLRNENLGESQRDIQKDIQKDVQSPSVSSFDQKKDFFENVLATKEEEVPMKEVQTEQKKEIIEDLQTIGQNQKGKTFEEKKEFFENIGTDKDEKVEEPPCPSDSQQKISPTEEWRNKYEGESQNLIGSESSDLECKERSSQKNIESNKDEKVSSYGSGSTTSFQQVKDSQLQSQDLSSKSQQERKDDSSFSTESPMQQGKDTSFGSTIPSSGSESSLKGKDTSLQQQKDTSLQSQDLSNKSQQERKDDSSFSTESPFQQGKDTSFGSTIPSSGSESSLKGKDTSFQQQKDTSLQSQDLSNKSQQERKDDSSFSTGSPMQLVKDTSFGSTIPSSGSESSLKGKDTSLQSQDLSNKSQQERKDDSSFSTESPMQQGKDTSFGSTIPSSGSESSLKGKDDTAFGSFFPKEGQTTQQGDLINFGQQNEYEKQGQESSFLGSVSSTLPQEVRSGETKQNKKDCCEHEDCNCKVGECDCNEKKDKDIKSRRRKKGFEPKDPSQFTDVPKQSYQPNDKDLI